MSTPLAEGKSFEISKWEVWQAYERVKVNKGAPGVDMVSLEDFEVDLQGNLYKVWNRMSSGSYFPPPVRAVPIPKPDGKVRLLGVPTIADRTAQNCGRGPAGGEGGTDVPPRLLRIPTHLDPPSHPGQPYLVDRSTHLPVNGHRPRPVHTVALCPPSTAARYSSRS